MAQRVGIVKGISSDVPDAKEQYDDSSMTYRRPLRD